MLGGAPPEVSGLITPAGSTRRTTTSCPSERWVLPVTLDTSGRFEFQLVSAW